MTRDTYKIELLKFIEKIFFSYNIMNYQNWLH